MQGDLAAGRGFPSNGSTRQGWKLFVQGTTNEVDGSHPQTKLICTFEVSAELQKINPSKQTCIGLIIALIPGSQIFSMYMKSRE